MLSSYCPLLQIIFTLSFPQASGIFPARALRNQKKKEKKTIFFLNTPSVNHNSETELINWLIKLSLPLWKELLSRSRVSDSEPIVCQFSLQLPSLNQQRFIPCFPRLHYKNGDYVLVSKVDFSDANGSKLYMKLFSFMTFIIQQGWYFLSLNFLPRRRI